jgi:hypothetical protein
VNGTDDVPADGIGGKEMSKELSDNAKTVGFQTVNRIVVLDK